MSDDGLPTEDQLRRLEQRVMTRIRRRAELPKRIATGAAVAALFVGGVFLLPRLGPSSGASGGSGSASRAYDSNRSGAGGSSGGSAALLAGCHATPSGKSAVRSVPLTADTPNAAVDACLVALEKGQVPTATTSSGTSANSLTAPLTAKDLVACRDAAGTLQVFVKDTHPSTLCARNGMHAP